MLSAEENALLTRTGPGTPMGDLMRQYWIPALMSSELPAPDCPRCVCACWERTSSPSARPPGRSGCWPTPAHTVALHCSSDATRPRAYGACTTAGSSTRPGGAWRCPASHPRATLKIKCAPGRIPVRSATASSSRIWGRARSLPRCRISSPTCCWMGRLRYGRPCGSATGCRPWREIWVNWAATVPAQHDGLAGPVAACCQRLQRLRHRPRGTTHPELHRHRWHPHAGSGHHRKHGSHR